MSTWLEQPNPFVAYWQGPDGATIAFVGWSDLTGRNLTLPDSGQRVPICHIAPVNPADLNDANLPRPLPNSYQPRNRPKASPPPRPLASAVKFLENALKNGPRAVRPLADEASALGISWSTLRRAKRQLNIVSVKHSKRHTSGEHWQWRLPDLNDEKDRAMIDDREMSRMFQACGEAAPMSVIARKGAARRAKSRRGEKVG